MDGAADNAVIVPWTRQLWPRLARLAWLKSSGTMIIMWLFFVVYLHIMWHPAYPVTIMPLTPVDAWIAFFPPALPLYASLWLYLSLAPALLLGLRELLAFALWIVLLCCAGLVFHYFWPTKVPPHDIGEASFWGFAMLRGVDAGGNACPSLHVATALFACLWLNRILRVMHVGAAGRALNAVWFVAITYSTIATRQHVFLDVVTGLALGAVFGAASLRGRAPVRWEDYRRRCAAAAVPAAAATS